MKRHRFLLILMTLVSLLLVAIPASAQVTDLGNDGMDMDCDDFPERNAVEGYFATDGGSAERNVDDLDPDADGIPCNEAIDDGTDDEGGFPLPAFTTYCEPGYAGPFDGCTPWDGVTVSFASADGEFATSCVTETGDRVASCLAEVPYSSTVTASIDPATVPAGYVLEGASSVETVIPDTDPEGVFGGANFVLLPEDPSEEPVPVESDGFPLPATTAYCEPEHAGPFVGCTPWEGITVTFVAIDTNFSTTCTTSAGERTANCSVEVPFGSTIEASIDPATVPAGYVLQGDAVQQLTIPDGPPEGVFGGPNFILLVVGDTGEDDPAVEEPEYVPPVVGDEPQTDPEPGDDEGETYVPSVIGDEPQTDVEPTAVTIDAGDGDDHGVVALPATGVGSAEGKTGMDLAIVVLTVATMLALSAGALSIHRSTR